MRVAAIGLVLSLCAFADGGVPDAGPVDAGVPVSTEPSTLIIRCPTDCLIYVDGLRKESKNKKGVTVEKVTPGSHQVVAKDVLNAVLGSGLIEVAPRSEVFVQIGSGKATVTSTKPIR